MATVATDDRSVENKEVEPVNLAASVEATDDRNWDSKR